MKKYNAALVRIISIFLLVGFWISASTDHVWSFDKRAKKIEASWKAWLKKKGVKSASIAVFYKDELVLSNGIKRSPEDAVPVASLSKAITGICLSKLVEKGLVDFRDTVVKTVPELKSDVSIGALLTHSSGYEKDAALTTTAAVKPSRSEFLERVSNAQVRMGRSKRIGKKFHYNNGNYALVGAVISDLTGKTYEEACNELVLRPIGIEGATINPNWRIMSSWGGWRISPVDYGRFINSYFAGNKVSGVSPYKLPRKALNRHVSYGLGVFFRKGGNRGINFWHGGSWDWRQHGRFTEFGAFFAKWDSGWMVIVTQDKQLEGHFESLDRTLWSAAHK